jgi:hypothetical protein
MPPAKKAPILIGEPAFDCSRLPPGERGPMSGVRRTGRMWARPIFRPRRYLRATQQLGRGLGARRVGTERGRRSRAGSTLPGIAVGCGWSISLAGPPGKTRIRKRHDGTKVGGAEPRDERPRSRAGGSRQAAAGRRQQPAEISGLESRDEELEVMNQMQPKHLKG